MALLAAQIGNANEALVLLAPLSASNGNFRSLRHVQVKAMARLGDYEGAIALLDNIALETLENNQSLILLRVRYLIEQRLWMRARRSLLNLLDSYSQPDLKWRYYMALVALNLGDVKTEEEQSIALAETEGGNHYAALYGRKNWPKEKARKARRPPWKRRYKKRLCGRKKRNTFSVMAMHWPILTRNWP